MIDVCISILGRHHGFQSNVIIKAAEGVVILERWMSCVTDEAWIGEELVHKECSGICAVYIITRYL